MIIFARSRTLSLEDGKLGCRIVVDDPAQACFGLNSALSFLAHIDWSRFDTASSLKRSIIDSSDDYFEVLPGFEGNCIIETKNVITEKPIMVCQ